MSKPEQMLLPVVGIMVRGCGKFGEATAMDNQFDRPCGVAYWRNRGYETEPLTLHTPAQAEIERLTAESDDARNERDAEQANARAEAALADARRLREALEQASVWIRSAPHGDNCFLHDDGGEYDACFCGKDGAESAIDAALAAPAAQPEAAILERFTRARLDECADILSRIVAFTDLGDLTAEVGRVLSRLRGEQAAQPEAPAVPAGCEELLAALQKIANWDCPQLDESRAHCMRKAARDALHYTAAPVRPAVPTPAPGAEAAAPDEMSPDFTDTARAALLWVLWHHQGGSSDVGQPIRFALGMGQHEHLNAQQVREAKRWAALPAEARHAAPAAQPEAPPWQPIPEDDLTAAEKFIAERRTNAAFFPADAHHLANITLHMIREVRATRTAPEAPAVPAGLYCVDDIVSIKGAISVFDDVLGDIADWEDKALAAAVTSARNDLSAIVESDALLAAAPTAPAVAVPPMLTPEQIEHIADDGHRTVSGGIYSTSVCRFAEDIIAERDKQWIAACGVRS